MIETSSDHRIVVEKKARFTLLSPSLVRMEFSPNGQFEERASVRAMGRPEPITFESVKLEGDEYILCGGNIEIRYSRGAAGFSSMALRVHDRAHGIKIWDTSTVDVENLGGVHVSMDCIKPGLIPAGVHPATSEHYYNTMNLTWWSHFWRFNNGGHDIPNAERYANKSLDEILATVPVAELPPLVQELVRERLKYPPGILSRNGFFVYNDAPMPVIDPGTHWITDRNPPAGSIDLYFFLYRKDFVQALKDYRLLFGNTPMMPRYALGLWYSRFPTFNQQELVELVGEFEKRGLPLDMLVLDLEWHQRGWYGFEWDQKHIPAPDELLKFLRERDIHTTFNIHPDKVPIEDSRYLAFLAAAGIEPAAAAAKVEYEGASRVPVFGDFDVSNPRHARAFMDVLHKPVQDQGVDFWWIDGSAPVRNIANLDSQLWTNHIYHEHMKANYPDRRSMIFSRTPGLGAHRYPFHFTGDTWCTWETLRCQVEQTLRAGHIGQSFITHDIGGHISNFLAIDPELYVRWVQFAVMNPVVRLHSSKQEEGVGGERRPWLYGERVERAFAAAMRFRMELLPYLYTLVWQSYADGLPLCRSNPIHCPDWEEGYRIWDAYFLGDRLYAAPVIDSGTMRKVQLPPGVWYNGLNQRRVESDGKMTFVEATSWTEAPLHYRKAGTLLVRQPYAQKASALPDVMRLDYAPLGRCADDVFTLYEDDGFSQYHAGGACATIRLDAHERDHQVEITVQPAAGNFDGFREKRHLELSLFGGTLGGATVNGVKVEVVDGIAKAVIDMRKGASIVLVSASVRKMI